MPDRYQIRLIFHHLVDVFVGTGYFIDYARIFTTDHSLGLGNQVLGGKAPLSGIPAHGPASTMGAGTKALRIPLSSDDVGPGTHAPRDDTQLSVSRADRALACDPDIGAKMVFPCYIVVMAVDYLGGLAKRRQVAR